MRIKSSVRLLLIILCVAASAGALEVVGSAQGQADTSGKAKKPPFASASFLPQVFVPNSG